MIRRIIAALAVTTIVLAALSAWIGGMLETKRIEREGQAVSLKLGKSAVIDEPAKSWRIEVPTESGKKTAWVELPKSAKKGDTIKAWVSPENYVYVPKAYGDNILFDPAPWYKGWNLVWVLVITSALIGGIHVLRRHLS